MTTSERLIAELRLFNHHKAAERLVAIERELAGAHGLLAEAWTTAAFSGDLRARIASCLAAQYECTNCGYVGDVSSGPCPGCKLSAPPRKEEEGNQFVSDVWTDVPYFDDGDQS